ncbi:MAG: protein kinase [Pirellulaceae bacterium]
MAKVRDGECVREAITDSWWEILGVSKQDMLITYRPGEEAGDVLTIPPPPRWDIEKVLGPVVEATNGVQFRRAMLRNRVCPDHVAMGKIYDLLHVDSTKRAAYVQLIKRHPEVMAKCQSARISKVHDIYAFEGNSGWWVIEEWLNGSLLSNLIEDNAFIPKQEWLIWLGTELILALEHLHGKKIIFRDLSPEKVHWVGDRIVLSDFEVAKLLGGTYSVVKQCIEESPYRAYEVYGNSSNLDPSCDIYSWARTILAAFSGNPMADPAQIDFVASRPQLLKIFQSCLSHCKSKRPQNVKSVLKIWQKLAR